MVGNLSEAPARETAITVVIADDHPLLRQGLQIMLRRGGIECLGEASTGREAVKLVSELAPDVVLMDIAMPDMDGLEATARIKEQSPGTPVVIITGQESKELLRRAIQAGATGYIPKWSSPDTLVEAIKLVKAGGSLIDAKLLAELLQELGTEESTRAPAKDGPLATLSPGERQVLELIASGSTNKEIAQETHRSVGTVKNVVQRIIEKLGVSDRTQAAVLAVRSGLLHD